MSIEAFIQTVCTLLHKITGGHARCRCQFFSDIMWKWTFSLSLSLSLSFSLSLSSGDPGPNHAVHHLLGYQYHLGQLLQLQSWLIYRVSVSHRSLCQHHLHCTVTHCPGIRTPTSTGCYKGFGLSLNAGPARTKDLLYWKYAARELNSHHQNSLKTALWKAFSGDLELF